MDDAGKRLLVVTGDFPVASETFIAAHIRGMIARGWKVAVCAGTIDPEGVSRLYPHNPPETFAVEAPALKFRKRFRFNQTRGLRRDFGGDWAEQFPDGGGPRMYSRAHVLLEFARAWRPDAVHCQFGFQAPFAGPVANTLGVPMLVVFRGNDFIRFPLEKGWGIYGKFPRRTVAIAHSDFCEGLLKRHLRVKVARVRRGVNRASFSPPKRADTWAGTVRLVVVGRLRFFKGHHLALESLALLRRLVPDKRFELTIVGGGDPEDSLWRKAEIFGLRERVELTGMLPPADVGEQMRKADIHVIPSQAGAEGFVENFCTVASEGLASGLAVVASNHGGIPEAVAGAGVLVPGGSALELARGIVHALNTDSPAGWAAKAAERAERYRDEQMMDDFERVTLEAIGD
ncbi:MAG: glycosyltransferase family 4 protein [Planctomycetes bacterium]|nr:glycosyltransferase family 4 protein [Planctomycetota bacterium]